VKNVWVPKIEIFVIFRCFETLRNFLVKIDFFIKVPLTIFKIWMNKLKVWVSKIEIFVIFRCYVTLQIFFKNRFFDKNWTDDFKNMVECKKNWVSIIEIFVIFRCFVTLQNFLVKIDFLIKIELTIFRIKSNVKKNSGLKNRYFRQFSMFWDLAKLFGKIRFLVIFLNFDNFLQT